MILCTQLADTDTRVRAHTLTHTRIEAILSETENAWGKPWAGGRTSQRGRNFKLSSSFIHCACSSKQFTDVLLFHILMLWNSQRVEEERGERTEKDNTGLQYHTSY